MISESGPLYFSGSMLLRAPETVLTISVKPLMTGCAARLVPVCRVKWQQLRDGSYRKVSLTDGEKRTVKDGESLGWSLEITRETGDLVDILGDLGGGDGRGHGGEAGHDESSETHFG